MTGVVTLILSIMALFESNPAEQQKQMDRIGMLYGISPTYTNPSESDNVSSDDNEESSDDDEESTELSSLIKKYK